MVKDIKLTGIIFLSVTCLTPFSSLALKEGFENLQANKIANQEKFNGMHHLLNTTSKGAPLTADVSDPIKIRAFNATEQDLADIKETINSITEICPNITYTLLESEDYSVKQDITIYSDAEIDESAYGRCTFEYYQNKAVIKYPLKIFISQDVDGIYSDSGKTLFSYVLKHEMMHSLGFCDLYEDKYFNESVMYYAIRSDTKIDTFTQMDINSIKQLYSYNLYATAKRPEKIKFINYVKKDEEEFSI